MTRRHWLGSLFAALAGFWAGGRARVAARPAGPPTALGRPPAPVGAAYPCGTYTYDSGDIPLCWSAACGPHVTLTTYSYGASGDSGSA